MSRHEIPARDQTLSVVVGWDNPLQTEPREVVTVEDLSRHLAPFADLSDETTAQLRADRAAKLGQAPTATQQELLAFIRRSR